MAVRLPFHTIIRTRCLLARAAFSFSFTTTTPWPGAAGRAAAQEQQHVAGTTYVRWVIGGRGDLLSRAGERQWEILPAAAGISGAWSIDQKTGEL
jgi:hypothetical protein